jgi:hypothetical protein
VTFLDVEKSRTDLPDDTDIDMIIISLCRIQNGYMFDAAEVAAGKLGERETGVNLTRNQA